MGSCLLHFYKHVGIMWNSFWLWPILPTHCRCIGILSSDHTQSHNTNTIGRIPLNEGPSHRRDQSDNTQHSQETDSHVSGGIRTRSPNKRAASNVHLRPRGHRDWLIWNSVAEVYVNRISVWDQYVETGNVSWFVFCGKGYLILIGLICNTII